MNIKKQDIVNYLFVNENRLINGVMKIIENEEEDINDSDSIICDGVSCRDCLLRADGYIYTAIRDRVDNNECFDILFGLGDILEVSISHEEMLKSKIKILNKIINIMRDVGYDICDLEV